MILQWVILVSVVIILIWTSLTYFLGWFNPVPEPDEGQKLLSPLVEATNSWTQALQPDPERGQCSSYNTFTSNLNAVDILPGIPEVPGLTCLDGTNMVLRKVSRTCMAKPGKVCLGSDGRTYKPNEVETYYAPCEVSKCEIASVIAQGVRMESGQLVPEAICLNSDGRRPTRCVNSYPEFQSFKVERSPLTVEVGASEIEAEEMRISILGTNLCLGVVNNRVVTFAPCVELEDSGFSWIFTPELPGPISGVIPSQLVWKESLDMPELLRLNMESNGVMSLLPLSQCNNPNICPIRITIEPVNLWEMR